MNWILFGRLTVNDYTNLLVVEEAFDPGKKFRGDSVGKKFILE